MSTYVGAIRLFNRDVRLFMLTPVLIGFTVFGGIYTVLLNLYLLRLGYGPEPIGLVNAAGNFATAAFAIPGIALSIRFGMRSAMIGGLIVCVIGYSLLPLGESLPASRHIYWVLAMFVLANFGICIYLISAGPFLMEATSPAERSHAFSMQIALFPLAGFAGSFAGGALPGAFATLLGIGDQAPAAYRYSLLLAALLLVPAVFALLAVRRPNDAPSLPDAIGAGPRPIGIILLLALISFLRVAGEGAARTFINVYMDSGLSVDTPQIGALVGIAQLAAVPIALSTPLITSRWGSSSLLLWGTAGTALTLLPLALVPHWAAAGVGFTATIALASLVRPAFMLYSMEVVSARWRTAMSGSGTLSVGLSWALTAYGGGLLIAYASFRAMFLAAATLTLLGAAIFWLHLRRRERG